MLFTNHYQIFSCCCLAWKFSLKLSSFSQSSKGRALAGYHLPSSTHIAERSKGSIYLDMQNLHFLLSQLWKTELPGHLSREELVNLLDVVEWGSWFPGLWWIFKNHLCIPLTSGVRKTRKAIAFLCFNVGPPSWWGVVASVCFYLQSLLRGCASGFCTLDNQTKCRVHITNYTYNIQPWDRKIWHLEKI